MSKENPAASGYHDWLELLEKRHLVTDDPIEKQRIQDLLDAEIDWRAMHELMGKLKTETSRSLLGRMRLACLVKHILSVSAELQRIREEGTSDGSEASPG